MHDARGRLLLVQRANPPAAGTWSLPGGRVEPGEDDAAAVAREVLEETGLVVTVQDLVGSVERDAPDGAVYAINDYACAPVGNAVPVAGDDARDVLWADTATMARLPLAPLVHETLAGWGVLPRC